MPTVIHTKVTFPMEYPADKASTPFPTGSNTVVTLRTGPSTGKAATPMAAGNPLLVNLRTAKPLVKASLLTQMGQYGKVSGRISIPSKVTQRYPHVHRWRGSLYRMTTTKAVSTRKVDPTVKAPKGI